MSGEKTDPGTINLGSLVVARHLTWKSDAPCIEAGQRGYGGRASQCVSMAEPTPPRLSDDLQGEGECYVFVFDEAKSEDRI